MVVRSPHITAAYAARVLCKSPGYVLSLIRAGLFKARKQTYEPSSKWVIDKQSFEAWLASLERNSDG